MTIFKITRQLYSLDIWCLIQPFVNSGCCVRQHFHCIQLWLSEMWKYYCSSQLTHRRFLQSQVLARIYILKNQLIDYFVLKPYFSSFGRRLTLVLVLKYSSMAFFDFLTICIHVLMHGYVHASQIAIQATIGPWIPWSWSCCQL